LPKKIEIILDRSIPNSVKLAKEDRPVFLLYPDTFMIFITGKEMLPSLPLISTKNIIKVIISTKKKAESLMGCF
jgi:hypothetical protein